MREDQTDPVADWKSIVLKYQKPSAAKGFWQIVNTLVPYALLWYLMYRALAVSWWITAPLAVLAGAFLVRVFIIFHANPLFQSVMPVTLFSSFKSLTFRLWDEQRRKLVGYRHLKGLRMQQAGAVDESV